MSSAARFDRQSVIVVCQEGLQLSQGVSAWMRHHGIAAQTLEGGFAAWRAEGHLLIPAERVPARDFQGRTVWVTRARPKIVRIACPWLIRRFLDPMPRGLFGRIGSMPTPLIVGEFVAHDSRFQFGKLESRLCSHPQLGRLCQVLAVLVRTGAAMAVRRARRLASRLVGYDAEHAPVVNTRPLHAQTRIMA
jgi:hypothetical protein